MWLTRPFTSADRRIKTINNSQWQTCHYTSTESTKITTTAIMCHKNWPRLSTTDCDNLTNFSSAVSTATAILNTSISLLCRKCFSYMFAVNVQSESEKPSNNTPDSNMTMREAGRVVVPVKLLSQIVLNVGHREKWRLVASKQFFSYLRCCVNSWGRIRQTAVVLLSHQHSFQWSITSVTTYGRQAFSTAGQLLLLTMSWPTSQQVEDVSINSVHCLLTAECMLYKAAVLIITHGWWLSGTSRLWLKKVQEVCTIISVIGWRRCNVHVLWQADETQVVAEQDRCVAGLVLINGCVTDPEYVRRPVTGQNGGHQAIRWHQSLKH